MVTIDTNPEFGIELTLVTPYAYWLYKNVYNTKDDLICIKDFILYDQSGRDIKTYGYNFIGMCSNNKSYPGRYDNE